MNSTGVSGGTLAPNGAVYTGISRERVGRARERNGLLVRDLERSSLRLEPTDESGFEALLGHSITYRIALGPQQGRKACMDSSSFASTSSRREGTTANVYPVSE